MSNISKELEANTDEAAPVEPIVMRPNSYAIARRACELFEDEYMGQQQKALWAWAIGKATHEAESKMRDA